ncbi:MAG: hypothetical protein U9N62_01520 [Thermotogota bacterium]|nr:hypothetical protein [Thermotogota bacterium]
MELGDLMDDIYIRSKYDQIQMIFENDIFIRRHSKISTASNGKDKFCIGFWENTLGELKYLIYDFHLQTDSEKIGRITRNCFNQKDLAGSESGVYCQRMIANVSNGIYSTPNRVKYQQGYSEFCKGEVSFNGDLINVNLGDYHYVFE